MEERRCRVRDHEMQISTEDDEEQDGDVSTLENDIGMSGADDEDSAELSHSLKVSDRSRIGPESFGIVVCRFVGTVPGIWGLVLLPFRPIAVPKSKTAGRILKIVRALLAQPSGEGGRLVPPPARRVKVREGRSRKFSLATPRGGGWRGAHLDFQGAGC